MDAQIDGGRADGSATDGSAADGSAADAGAADAGAADASVLDAGRGVRAHRWHPGHYVKTSGNATDTNQSAYFAGVQSTIDRRVGSDPEVLGAYVDISWRIIETAEGVYDFTRIRSVLDDLAARGKYLILGIPYKGFGGTGAFVVPAYLSAELYTSAGRRGGGNTYVATLWKAPTMDRYIAMWEAVAAEFDGDPNLEMVTWSESTPSLRGARPPGYSTGALATQLERLYVASSAAFRRTNVAAMINFLAGVAEVGGPDGLLEAAYAARIGRGAPDLLETNTFALFRGEASGGVVSARDYRGAVPHMAIWSGPAATRGNGDTDTPADALTWAFTQGVTHLLWVSYAPGEDSWSNILAAIAAARSPSDIGDAACPSQYAALGGCR